MSLEAGQTQRAQWNNPVGGASGAAHGARRPQNTNSGQNGANTSGWDQNGVTEVNGGAHVANGDKGRGNNPNTPSVPTVAPDVGPRPHGNQANIHNSPQGGLQGSQSQAGFNQGGQNQGGFNQGGFNQGGHNHGANFQGGHLGGTSWHQEPNWHNHWHEHNHDQDNHFREHEHLGWGRGDYWTDRWGRKHEWRLRQRDANLFLPVSSWHINNVAGLVGLCKLFINETTLSCVASKGIVECPVVFNSTFFNTTAFGLAKMTTMNYTTTPSDKQQFSIFPRSEDNTNWLNSTLMFNSTLYNLALYTTNATATCGIRVVDPACFADLGSLFHSIEVEDDMFGAITLI